jgi:hypothetical protein
MPIVRVLRSRGARTVIVANGETLFGPGGPIPSWNRRFSNTVQRFTQKAAPSQHSGPRDRWSHQGKTLKQSFRSNTQIDVLGMKVHFAVGSTKGYALYVDQGTDPFQAKILPPWRRGQASLYEHTWRPGPGQPPVGTISVRGQDAQNFFASGLRNGFRAMRIASVVLPGERPEGLRGFPGQLANFALDVDQTLFRANLEQWREWRDAAFHSDRDLGDGSKPRPPRKSRAKAKAVTRAKTAKPKSSRRPPTEREKEKLSLAAQARRNKNRLAREAAEERAARQRVRARVLENKAKAYIADRRKRAKGGTTISLGKMLRHGEIVGYVVTVTTPSGRKTKREFN